MPVSLWKAHSMEVEVIRKYLHDYLEVADDKKLKAIYTIMEAEISDLISPYPEELKAELKQRNTDYKNGTAKTVTAEKSQARIQAILNRVRE